MTKLTVQVFCLSYLKHTFYRVGFSVDLSVCDESSHNFLKYKLSFSIASMYKNLGVNQLKLTKLNFRGVGKEKIP